MDAREFMIANERDRRGPASGCTSPSDCWPLPPEWDTAIPPQPVVVRHGTNDHYRTSYTVPVWDKEWLRGLESFVRSIVRDEISKANAKHERQS
jgi:hypothetical protein